MYTYARRAIAYTHVHRWWNGALYRHDFEAIVMGKVKPRRHLLWSSGKWRLSILKSRVTKHSRFWTAFLTTARVEVGKLVVGYARLSKLDGPGPVDWDNTSSSCLERPLRFATKRGDLRVATGGGKGFSRLLWGRRLPRNETGFASTD